MTVDNGTAEGEGIGIFEVVPEPEAAGESGDPGGQAGNLTIDIERCRLPFHVSAEREDHLRLSGGFPEPLHQGFDGQISRADAVDGGDDAAENMVDPVVLAGCLYAHHIPHALHNADGVVVSLGVAADAADLGISYHIAFLAGKHVEHCNHMAELGTRLAHIDGGVPQISVCMEKVDAKNLGSLLYFFEFACGISAYTLGVNPFNQPGVEAYKKNMFALLEKPGYEEATKAIKERI